jgi:hypothetical protein
LLTKPGKLTIDQDGNVTDIGPGQQTLPVQKGIERDGRLELTIDGDAFVMTLVDHEHATLTLEGMRPWPLERIPQGQPVALATSLPAPNYPPEIRQLREKLHGMVTRDQAARLDFDSPRMEAIDAENRDQVVGIFRHYGWITNSLAGPDAAHDFWLLVQHQTPEIQRELLPALDKAAHNGDASMADYAYLYDRVQVGLGKPQRWGTQVRCEGGQPVLPPVERRKELYLMPVADYLKSEYIVRSCARQSKQ